MLILSFMKRKCAEMSWKLLVAQKSEPVLWRTLHQAFHLLILFFYSETSLVFKFNQVTCLPFYLLILCVSWSSVSASKLFLYELVKFLWSQWLSGGGGEVRRVRTHLPPNIKCLFWNVKCPFLLIIPFNNISKNIPF